MPTNLPAEAKSKWHEVSLTKEPKAKLQLMQEFLSLVPKHKGTEKLRAQVKRQMAILRREIEEKKHKKTGRSRAKSFVEKEGAAQLVVLGPTNAGRSSLLSLLTNAKVEISDYPFTTREPTLGMFQFEDIQFQIIEAPPISYGLVESQSTTFQALALARNADGLIIMVDLSYDPCAQMKLVLDELEKARILISEPGARIEIERKHMGAGLQIIVLGRLLGCTSQEVEGLLRSYKIRDATVKIMGEATLDDIENSLFEGSLYKPTLILANKIDLESATENLKALEHFVGNTVRILPVSCKTGYGIEKLGLMLFNMLGIIRVYTKDPAEKTHSPKPFIMKKDSTIQDLARMIHSDFIHRFSFARVWADRLVHSPQKAGLSFRLEDKDIVEIHTKQILT
jgi:ribosome-interacting GTPase 1